MYNRINSEDKKRIKEAVRKVEKTTSGEIVTYFIKKSGNYLESSLIVTLFSIIIFLITICVLSYLWLLPFSFNVINYSISIISFSGIIFLITYFIPPVKRLIISKEKKVETVHKKALQVFLDEEIFNTKDRTGILIFISSFEHQVHIITDKGIEKFLKPEEKNELVNLIIKGIKDKKPAEGIIQAIHLYGNLLVNAGYEIKQDDTNELSDEIRTELK